MVQVDEQLVGACIARAGWRRGPRIALFMGEWALVEHEAGRELGMEEFVELAPMSRATAYRRVQEFRDAFPELGPGSTPAATTRVRISTGDARASARVVGA
jgi:hypothetical protein